MTEFSRYLTNLPPHVRYVVLDESPELVYDLIDRLTEILIKRQNMFKGKWEKLDDVPVEKYMPAIFVVIDEFSVMSQILVESITSGKDDYSLKLQTLLAKGAALGFHFIFSSQAFTTGSRGLNEFSKRQVQQRIALKSDVNEIKAGLELHSIGDVDKTLTEQLEKHHTLYKSRVPVDLQGNYLIHSKVLYFPDASVQQNFIKNIKSAVTPITNKYLPYDESVYVDKQPLILDGNSYSSFFELKSKMINAIRNNNYDDDETPIFIGEPRRLLQVHPIVISSTFQENVLIISSVSEKNAVSSITCSFLESLKINDLKSVIISSKKDGAFKHFYQNCNYNSIKSITDVDLICNEIKNLKQRISSRINANVYYFIFGLETLYSDFSFATSMKENSQPNITFNERKPGQLDINSILDNITAGDNPQKYEDYLKPTSKPISTTSIFPALYDAREDLKYILTQGPKLGYHFILNFNSVGDYNQTKLPIALFNHRILFRTARSEALGIVDSRNAGVINELPLRCFRYFNGLDSLSFRPYLHYGIELDGYTLTENGVTTINNEEENLLQ